MRSSLTRTQLWLAFLSFTLLALTFAACEMRLQIPSSTNAPDLPKYEFEATGEDFLISALEEVQAIADWSDSFRNVPSARLSDNSSAGNERLLTITGTDTVYVYGQIIAGGFGAVVTEQYAHPKGLVLITVRKTFGKENGRIVTETKRYASYTDHQTDHPQQTNVTEMYGCQTDTIVAHVLRDGTLQTYTFRLPVVTKVVNPQDGSVRVTKRYASNGAIVSKVEDANGNLVQLTRNYGQSDGSTVTRTEYPDGSWRQVRTHGEADGTVTRETTSGLPTLGSGNIASPTNIPRPVFSLWIPLRSYGSLHYTNPGESMQYILLVASGCMPPVIPPPRPRFTRSDESKFVFVASGDVAYPRPPLPILSSCQSMPPLLPWPAPASRILNTVDADLSCALLASGNTVGPLVVPRPVMSLITPGNSMIEARSTSVHTIPSARSLLASDVTTCPEPPIPDLASGATPITPHIPRPVMGLFTPAPSSAKHRLAGAEAAVSGEYSLCSGWTITPPRPPHPIFA